MNYSYPPCQNKFTSGQGARMRWVIDQAINDPEAPPPLVLAIANNGFTDIVISNAETWDLSDFPDGKVTVYQSLVIEGGASLSIQPGITVQFAPTASLIVKPNALLELDGTLTSYCGTMWRGVAVWGDCTKSQFQLSDGTYAQGRFVGKIRGVVENAEIGIRLYGPDINKAGGQISCTGTTFRNNYIAVDFKPYKNKPANVTFASCSYAPNEKDYRGFFNGCAFETNDAYPLTLQPFEVFIKMSGVRGVKIFSPFFTNIKTINDCNTGNYDECHGFGIKAFNSGFWVARYLSPSSLAPEFRGLSYGIHSESSGAKPVTITGSNFRNCYKGIYADQGAVIDVTLNKFYLGQLPDPDVSDRQFGTIFYKNTAFKYLDNRFFGPAGNVEKIVGTCTNESGDLNNLIVRNKYDGIAIGNVANGTNGGFESGIPRGLQYHCNDNTNNYGFDFSLPTGGDVIRQRQGELVNNNKISTGNLFSHNPTSPESDFSNHGGQNTNYYHVADNLQTPSIDREVPLYQFGIAPDFENVFPNPDCNTGIEVPPTPLTGTDLQNEKNRYYSERAGYLQEKSAYLAALQSGNQTAATQHAERAAQYRFEMDLSAREVLHSLVRDTLNDQRDSARQWLLNIETFEADLFLVLDYLDNGETAQALSAYNAIPTRLALTADQQQDYVNFGSIVSVLSVQSMYDLDNGAQQSLLNVAQQPKGFAVQTAKSILQLYGHAFTSPECILPECCGALRGANSTTWENPKNFAIDFKVSPNPASDMVFFDCPSCVDGPACFITMQNISGQEVWRREIVSDQTQATWLAGQAPVGLYFYKLTVGGQLVKSGKISLIR